MRHLLLFATVLPVLAQQQQPPPIVSPEVTTQRTIVFRLRAPDAKVVKLVGGDIPKEAADAAVFTKDDQGVWTATSGALVPGAYRYRFNIDGVQTVDPSNPVHSESLLNLWSQANVPGSDVFDLRDVPHGGVTEVPYYSTVLKKFRRLHVYTPPGYTTNTTKYPVFYLLHGSSDSDDSWSSVGRAGVILDNLIADKKARPMVVVMPCGHTQTTMGRGVPDEFSNEFSTDIQPFVEKTFRVLTDRAHTAIAGLSMGGRQTMDIGVGHLDRFAYIGVFSSGVSFGQASTSPFEEKYKANLDNPKLKKGLQVLWMSTGVEDRLMPNTKAMVELMKKHGFEPVFKESPGGHTWLNWRNYLTEFVPMLFKS